MTQFKGVKAKKKPKSYMFTVKQRQDESLKVILLDLIMRQ